MRVLVVSQYFPPETGGPQNRVASLVDGLRAAGHEVHVITEKPNYPTGVVWDGYREKFFLDSDYNGVPVTYAWIFADPKKRTLTRLLFYVSFMLSSVAASFRLRGRFDVVLATSPPLFVGLAGWAISKLKRAKFVFDVRDLWPDVAVAMGELANPRVADLAKRVEAFIYREADGITAVTDSFCEDIRRLAGSGKAVTRITNGTVPEHFQVAEPKPAVRERLSLPSGAFIVTYAGNLGLAQGLDHVLDAAALTATDSDVLFLLVGAGAARDRLAQEAQRRALSNVRFVPRVPLEEAAAYMAASDALLVPLGKHGIYRKFIPSKLFDSMASERPVLLSVPGESKAILEEAEAGLYYAPEDGAALAEAVRALKASPDTEVMGKRGAAYVAARFSRAKQAEKLVAFLEEIVQDDALHSAAAS